MIGKHLNAEPPSLGRPQLATMDAVLSRALAKDPKDRFPTCADFVDALEASVEAPDDSATTPTIHTADTMQAPVAAPVARESDPPARRSRGRLVAMATGAAAVVVAIAVVGYLALQPAEAPPSGEPFTLDGTLKVVGNNVKTVGLPNGYKCAGAKEFGDIAPDAPITIEDKLTDRYGGRR